MLDRMEMLPRYYQVALNSGKSVLLPMMYMRLRRQARAPINARLNQRMIDTRQKEVRVASLNSAQFENVPLCASSDFITLLEEDKVQAYYGGAHVYGSPQRTEPFI